MNVTTLMHIKTTAFGNESTRAPGSGECAWPPGKSVGQDRAPPMVDRVCGAT